MIQEIRGLLLVLCNAGALFRTFVFYFGYISVTPDVSESSVVFRLLLILSQTRPASFMVYALYSELFVRAGC